MFHYDDVLLKMLTISFPIALNVDAAGRLRIKYQNMICVLVLFILHIIWKHQPVSSSNTHTHTFNGIFVRILSYHRASPRHINTSCTVHTRSISYP